MQDCADRTVQPGRTVFTERLLSLRAMRLGLHRREHAQEDVFLSDNERAFPSTLSDMRAALKTTPDWLTDENTQSESSKKPACAYNIHCISSPKQYLSSNDGSKVCIGARIRSKRTKFKLEIAALSKSTLQSEKCLFCGDLS